MAFTQISGNGLKNNSITNAHLHNEAAIAGSKIDPDFGTKNILSTGQLQLTSQIPAIFKRNVTGTNSVTVLIGNNTQTYALEASSSGFSINDYTNVNTPRFSIDGSKIVSSLNHDFSDGIDVTGNITVSGTVDGRDLATDGTKLDGIANNANNVTNYVTNDAGDILAGDTYTFLSSTNQKIVLSGASNPFIRFQEGTTDKAYIQWNADGYLRLRNEEAQDELRVADGNNGLQFVIDGTARNVFHAGNSNFVTADASDELSGDTYTFSGSSGQKIILNGATNPYIHFHEGTTAKAYIQWNSAGYLELHNQETSEAIKIASGSNGLLFRHGGTDKTVWHSGNSNFVTADASDTLTGGTYTFSSSTAQKIILSGATNPYIRFQEGTTNKAYLQWHGGDGAVLLVNEESGEYIKMGSGNNGLQFIVDGTARNVMHSGNVSTYALPIGGGTLTGNLTVGANADIRFTNGTWTGNHCKIQHHSDYLYIVGGSNGIVFREAGTSRWYIDGSGHFIPNGSNNYNIGEASNRVEDIHVDNVFANGGGGAVTIKDGSDIRFQSGTWTGEATCKLQLHSNVLYLQAPAFLFRDDGGTNRWQITSSGHFQPVGNGNYHIGDASNRVNNIYGNALFLGQSSRYLSNVNGDYGSIQINGSGANGYEGFSIDGRAVFMHDGGGNTGIYNDVNNEWMLYCGHNTTSILYFNGAQRVRTEDYGCRFAGTIRPNATSGSGSGDCGASDARWKTAYFVNQPNVSDRNEKNTIQSSDLGLSFINKLRAVSFKWNDTSLGIKTRYGLIVQEVEEAVKELGKDPDDMGMIDKPEKGAMGLCTNELIAPLVKAIQELSAKVAALETT